MINEGSHVLTNPEKPTYFPQKNIQAAIFTILNDLLPEYLI